MELSHSALDHRYSFMAKTNFKMMFLNAEIRIPKYYIMASKGSNLKDVKPKHGDLVNGSI